MPRTGNGATSVLWGNAVGWKTRRNGRTYYYHSVRRGDRVASRYVGAGPVAEELAELVELEARAATANRAACRRFVEADREAARYCRGVEMTFRASLMAAGYRQHQRGEWRKQMSMPQLTSQDEPRKHTRSEVVAVLKRAQEGDHEVLPDLQAILQGPGRTTLLRFYGNASDLLRRRSIAGIAGKNLLAKEAVEVRVNELEQELTPPDATPIERLLVGRVVTCWLALHEAETIEADGRGRDIAPQMRELQQRRVDRSHNRFLSAVKALETAQRLRGGPTVVRMSRTETLTVKSD